MWGTGSIRRCIHCGKGGARTVEAFGYSHRRCWPEDVRIKREAKERADAKDRRERLQRSLVVDAALGTDREGR